MRIRIPKILTTQPCILLLYTADTCGMIGLTTWKYLTLQGNRAIPNKKLTEEKEEPLSSSSQC